MKRKVVGQWIALAVLGLFTVGVRASWAASLTMHIMEGYLPLWWAVFWWAVAAPFWAIGLYKIRKNTKATKRNRLCGFCVLKIWLLS